MAYQINLTGKEIDERLQNVGTPEDVAAADGTLYARISKNADDVDELNDTVMHIQDAQAATDKTVTQHTANISTLQTAMSENKTAQDAIAQKVEENATAIGKNGTVIYDHELSLTNIGKVVSGERETYFVLKRLRLRALGGFAYKEVDIDNVEVRLYRWSGKRYSLFQMFKDGEIINYTLWLKQEHRDGADERTPYITFHDDNTEVRLSDALKDRFGDRVGFNSKKNRWRIQAYLNAKPLTAPFDFCVSVDANNNYSLTKGGMMRSVPTTAQVKYDGFYNADKWLECKKGAELNLDYHLFGDSINSIERKFPNPGDVMVMNASSHTVPRGVIISVFQDTPGSYCILWSDGISIYEIGIDLDSNEYGGYNCYSPAKKLCDNIYDYASKMNSGTLRDLYISAGAKYNEATGFYELNGLTDITEEEMKTIWQENLSGWYLNGRTNLTMNIEARGNAGAYNGGIDICNMCRGNKNITIFNFYNSPFIRGIDNAFSGCTKLETIDTRFPITPYNGVVGPNTFRGCSALKEVRFNMRYVAYSTNVYFPASPLISKDSVLSVIKTTKTEGSVKPLVVVGLNETAYNRLKDDTDITAALTEKNGFVTLTQI